MNAVLVLLLAQSAIETYQRANALLERRDLEGARAAVEEALRSHPKYVPALILRAKLAANANQLDEAQRSVEAALAVDPAERQARFLLGFVSYLKNDFARARAALAAADANDARVVFYRALTDEALNNTEAAVANYERAIRMDRSSSEPRVAYARLLFAQGRADRAEALIDQALKLSPGSADALYEKGRCLLERGAFAQAADFGERALSSPESAVLERRIRYLLVRAYQKTGDRERAAMHQAAFERLPNPLVR
jgi:tetratricopeptide (TPR) repeat protein